MRRKEAAFDNACVTGVAIAMVRVASTPRRSPGPSNSSATFHRVCPGQSYGPGSATVQSAETDRACSDNDSDNDRSDNGVGGVAAGMPSALAIGSAAGVSRPSVQRTLLNQHHLRCGQHDSGGPCAVQ